MAAEFGSLAVARPDATIQAWQCGSGEPLVLMQYFRRSSRRHFQHLVTPLLDAGFSLVAADPRAIGGNGGDLSGLTYHELAADVSAVIHEIDRGPVHVLATGAAALTARCLAADAPELVRSLVLVGPGAIGEPFPRQPDPDALQAYRKIFFGTAFDSEDRRQAIQDAAYSPASGGRAAVDDYELRDVDAIAFLQIVAATRVSDYWHGGDAPMLIVQGADDRICHPDNSRAFRDEFPERARLVEIPGSGHLVVNEQPGAIVRETVEFVRSDFVRSRRWAS